MAEVVVVTGIGGIGVACARRLGFGRKLVLADINSAQLSAVAEDLGSNGLEVTAVPLDITDRNAVSGLARKVSELGQLRALIHTAGLSLAQAPPERVMEMDALGTEWVLDAFSGLVVEGSVAVCTSSMAAYLSNVTSAQENLILMADADDLPDLLRSTQLTNRSEYYSFAKRENQLRVEHYAVTWGKAGGRVVSISPGIISTPMGRLGLADAPKEIGGALALSPISRIGAAEDVAAAVAWLVSAEAAYISGCDLRIDDGLLAALRGLGDQANRLQPA